MPPTLAPQRRFALGDVPLAGGGLLPAAWLDYRVYGTLAADRANLVLYPSSYGAWPEDIDWVVGPILDPERWCVVLVSQFGNGRSSSPSTGDPALAGGRWPVDHRDNVAAQRRLLEEVFAVTSPALIYGWSMGAQQAYHWAVLEPERTQRVCCVCGTARTTPHNRVFLLSLRQALTADPSWDGRRFRDAPEQGLRTFALIYASWAASQPFYRRGAHHQLGYPSVEAYVEEAWLPAYRRHDPHDLLAMLDVWLANDVAVAAGLASGDAEADLAAALGRIRASTTVIAGRHDLYFTPEDCGAEAALISGAHFEVLESDLGHRAGNPRDAPSEQRQLRAAVDRLCAG
ncbi:MULTISPECIES: alpha/beta fold hydrolase [unclassified Cyanobium]|uniref:alpha/beta fold hydrolase n=1 Tax=unclassified Cyanobium TaxID=2627006 RepID=UPI0020CD0207|nr:MULTISPECIES: alpha/beta fold hydrolase [unclassified Cyanobium]MCP9835224.1 alpha/beta fold hydrolase [Cyanobium sp. La Preciosa 7G6]MCP9937989.1 alpha/beta fold hydrolase [Cyanobium sp. Aljojuca 7A6]